MKRLFDYENPIVGFFNWLSEMIVLNFITLLGCIPIITIGASVTASHYAALKLRRSEGSIVKNYWKSFKENLKQATVLWIMFLVYLAVNYLAYITLSTGKGTFPLVLQGILIASSVFAACIMLWVFPLQSRFCNPVFKTIRVAFFLNFKYIFRTILMFIFAALPFFITIDLFSLFLLFGFSVPIYFCSACYNKLFQRFEMDITGEDNSESPEEVATEV